MANKIKCIYSSLALTGIISAAPGSRPETPSPKLTSEHSHRAGCISRLVKKSERQPERRVVGPYFPAWSSAELRQFPAASQL